jgi:ribosome-binding protein aMBF1 (putative translation factor)
VEPEREEVNMMATRNRQEPKNGRQEVPRRIQEELGNRIRRRRTKSGVTRKGLAKACGMDPGHIGLIERGSSNIRLSTLVRLANNLDTTVTVLLRGLI